jgi:predicted MFS family arabinose efflux permease
MTDHTESRSDRRLVLLLCWASFTMTSADRSAWGPASAEVGAALGVSLAGLGGFATAYYTGYVIASAFGGVLADRLGGRVVLPGSLFAVGVFLTATSLGTVLANAIVPTLIEWSGWRASYHLFGGVSMALAVLCLLFLKDGVSAGEPAWPDPRPLPADRSLLLLGLAGFGGLWGTYGFVTWSNTLMVKGGGIDPVTAGGVVVLFGIVAVVCKPLIGSAAGATNALWRLGSVTVPLVIGAVYQATGSFPAAFAALAAGPLAGAVLMAFVREGQTVKVNRGIG